MIDFLQQPEDVHLSHQDAEIRVITDEHVTGTRALMQWYFDLTTPFVDFPSDPGHDVGTHYVEILGENFEVRGDASGLLPINEPGKQIHPFWTAYYTPEEWAAHFEEMLRMNSALTEKWNIIFSPGGGTSPIWFVDFLAKDYGDIIPPTAIRSYWSEDAGYSVWVYAYENNATITNGTEAVYDEGVRVGLEILDGNDSPITSNPWWRTPMFSDLSEFDGVSYWEIAHVLQNKIAQKEMGFSTDYVAGFSFVRHRNFFQYRLRATVMLSDGTTTTVTTRKKYCFFGKPSWYKQAIWNETGGSFYNDILNGKFLTQQPLQKKVGWKGPEWLYFLNPYNNADCTIEVKCFYNDDSETTKTLGPFEAYPYDTWQIDVSPITLQLSGTPIRYEVYVKLHDNTNGNDYTTETRIYDIDYTAYAHDRRYVFRNHFGGGFDTMRATGMLKATGKVERESIKKELPKDYKLTDFEYQLVSAEFNAEFELNWGFLQQYGGDVQQWIQYMRQLELSDMAFEYMEGQVFPCQFLTEKWTMYNDENPNTDHVSTFRRAYVDKGHANDPIELAPDYNDDFNEDYLT